MRPGVFVATLLGFGCIHGTNRADTTFVQVPKKPDCCESRVTEKNTPAMVEDGAHQSVVDQPVHRVGPSQWIRATAEHVPIVEKTDAQHQTKDFDSRLDWLSRHILFPSAVAGKALNHTFVYGHMLRDAHSLTTFFANDAIHVRKLWSP